VYANRKGIARFCSAPGIFFWSNSPLSNILEKKQNRKVTQSFYIPGFAEPLKIHLFLLFS
jgi:hypothetical protein